ncbi:hypothetical protein ERJ75_000355900 [Trypanosoma vivax]|uniref:Uncharacterized protein n=1 Tax=Trypanosoma vivax (strain Y486) TaxID=1055687 RepID=G0TZZ0_TRYVY|nr:hypothetical protein TRVL_07868 [Trypanosoma vivax]KAH8617634.1 hypothetical protein ERJ75_000355900 [Trypanosoma vivax]CCC50170.1 conserved hypothetical protein [Trypanosoma vivax Y486]
MTFPSAEKRLDAARVRPPKGAHTAPTNEYHNCKCYGHVCELPDYKQLCAPRTLQGFYAKQDHACPCNKVVKGTALNELYCCHNPATRGKVCHAETYRVCESGNHQIFKAKKLPASGVALRDPATGNRLVFPNACNYNGTAAQRKFPGIGEPRRKTYEERMHERMHDRKEFLKAVLRDEMRDRLEAERHLSEIENEIGLRGSRHVRALAEAASIEALRRAQEDGEVPMTADERYKAVMDELHHVTRQPVGFKQNIIRMHYTLQEDERQVHLQEGTKKMTYRCAAERTQSY